MGVKEKIKDKDKWKLLKCPFTELKEYCIAEECGAWEFTDDNNIYGYCILIQNK